METAFFSRSAYKYMLGGPPRYFLELEKWFDSQFIDQEDVIRPQGTLVVDIARNLCTRMGDVFLYAMQVVESMDIEDPDEAAVMTSSYLVGYFSASKSVLDACSVAINELFNMGLPNKEQDFRKGKFLQALSRIDPEAGKRYVRFKPHVDKIVRWRDSAVHRISPLALPAGKGGDIHNIPRSEIKIKIFNEPDVSIRTLIKDRRKRDLIEPTVLIDEWDPIFHDLVSNVCDDIKRRGKID